MNSLLGSSFSLFRPTQWAQKCEYKPTINPMAVKFIPERNILPNPADFFEIDDIVEAKRKSPLAEKIFGESKKIGDVIDFITFTPKFITVTLKNGSYFFLHVFFYLSLTDIFFQNSTEHANIWKKNKEFSDILANLVDKHLAAGEEVVLKTEEQKNVVNSDNPTIALQIHQMINDKIRAGIQQDGGDISFIKFQKGVVYVRLHGACSGCPHANDTLKFGVEEYLVHSFPKEVVGVYCLEDAEPDSLIVEFVDEEEKKPEEKKAGEKKAEEKKAEDKKPEEKKAEEKPKKE